jgi:hypothetical protein
MTCSLTLFSPVVVIKSKGYAIKKYLWTGPGFGHFLSLDTTVIIDMALGLPAGIMLVNPKP